MIDTHAHVYVQEFEDDRAGIIEQAVKEGVTKILMPAIDSESHQDLLEAEKQFPAVCRAMMGLHPCSVKENYREELKLARQLLEAGNFIAIGETGLDFYWDRSFTDSQYAALDEQIGWALEYDIPVVLHSRESIDECIKVIANAQKGSLKGVFHCFSGNEVQARQIIGLGFFLGIGGVLTFRNSGLDKVMKELDLRQVILETDAPYLAPVPFRGKRNEPAYLKYVAQKLAEIKQLPVEEIERITTENANRLFGLDALGQ